ncbi:peptidyl-tRNA hydrolase 2, mitochondrial-like [Penaeus japonicus]|uniref:peptidyl-tRNA hydrolase 2, mitochondrial-like n=1 Tax=Penaeus japonicus TaxID=27405 RepID=UPI001C714EE7|nr:peptidyl-tRNA hydrolase 2, mitochondrial-like [Penaeus japonicus]XP_042861017.1 peptidyl-tRNA hydrolase 2, mitochondrial-like [Penaeus japonicus]
MDAFNGEHPSEKYLNFQNVSLMVTSFLAGLYIGKKMSNTVTRVRNLVSTGPSKLVLVVRQDLKMGKGKIAAQCSHATLASYKKMQKVNPHILQAWEDLGQPKVVVRAVDLNHINSLSQLARAAGIETTLIHDAGKTQVETGSATVLAVGPASIATIDKITGNLPLL